MCAAYIAKQNISNSEELATEITDETKLIRSEIKNLPDIQNLEVAIKRLDTAIDWLMNIGANDTAKDLQMVRGALVRRLLPTEVN